MAQQIFGVLLMIGTIFVLHNNLPLVHSCPPRAVVAVKDLFKSRVHSVNGPSCYILESLRTAGDNEGTYNNSGVQSFKTCRELCKTNDKLGKIIAIELELCHCNKEFKRKGMADVNKCTNVCPGRVEERCGGPDHISAYPSDMKIDY